MARASAERKIPGCAYIGASSRNLQDPPLLIGSSGLRRAGPDGL